MLDPLNKNLKFNSHRIDCLILKIHNFIIFTNVMYCTFTFEKIKIYEHVCQAYNQWKLFLLPNIIIQHNIKLLTYIIKITLIIHGNFFFRFKDSYIKQVLNLI